MTVEIRYVTDPACAWSWGFEPILRRLQWEFGEQIAFRPVMAGLARTYGPAYRDEEGKIGSGPSWRTDLTSHWLDVSARTGMPCDPRLWTRNPISSTYPAGMAVLAAREQGNGAAMALLRRLREGLLCERLKLDTLDSLAEQAALAGLDVPRFRIDANSQAIIEAFGADLEVSRAVDEAEAPARAVRRAEGDRQRFVLPTLIYTTAPGQRRYLFGTNPYETYREAMIAAGAEPDTGARPGVIEAIERFGRLATRELEELTGIPTPILRAELWTLARDWQLKPDPILISELWSLPA